MQLNIPRPNPGATSVHTYSVTCTFTEQKQWSACVWPGGPSAWIQICSTWRTLDKPLLALFPHL